MQNIFKIGQEVCAKKNPGVKLIISNFNERIYFCRYPYNPSKKDLVLYEEEIMSFERGIPERMSLIYSRDK